MYLGMPCYGYGLNCLFFHLIIPGHFRYLREKSYLFYLHVTLKHEILICSNKHETCLVCNGKFVSDGPSVFTAKVAQIATFLFISVFTYITMSISFFHYYYLI